ncbi:MAG: hypothetical protein AAF050_12155 [Cyanobacteria bacterium J06649_5]
MVALAIASTLGLPIVVLAVGFLGVSRKRAEESREHLTPLVSVSTDTSSESVQPRLPAVNSTAMTPLTTAPGGATS